MPGHIRIRYEREPDFFHAMGILGSFSQVVAGVEEGRVLGFGCRSVRPMYVNGEACEYGYLSSLRSSLQGKQRLGLARGYQLFRTLHEDGRCEGYFSTIIDGNADAVSTIASGRAGLPTYHPLGTCTTYAVSGSRWSARRKDAGIQVRFAEPGEEGRVISLLNRYGPASHFFPVLHERDFGSPLLRDLPVTRFLIAEDAHGDCGVAGLWDQSGFKQHRIIAYSPWIHRIRYLLNAGLVLSGRNTLPPPGQNLPFVYLCFRAVRDQDPAITRALVSKAREVLRQSRGTYLVTGCHERDPCRIGMEDVAQTRYRSRLYAVGWEKELPSYIALDNRVPYFDPAIL